MVPRADLAWVVAGYRVLGLDLETDASAVGISPRAVLDDPQGLVGWAAYAELLRRALARNPAFAVDAGHRCPFGTFLLLDCTTAACGSLREAIAALDRYFALVTQNGHWRLEGDVLELVPQGALPDWFRIASFELGLHYTAARFDEVVARPVVRGLEVPWPAPAWASAYPRPTTFGSSRAAILLDESALDAPSRRADPLVAQALARSAGMVLEAMPWVSPLQGQVHAAIVALLPRGLPGMTEVARELATSTRTLRRRLAAEGLTFERVRDDALAAIARERLRDPRQSVAEVAYVLGFSDVRAFHRAFQRWTGVTPGQFRRPANGATR